ncbi:MAG: hypothetical protein ACOYNS_17315 [Bacteroidota bacterium]
MKCPSCHQPASSFVRNSFSLQNVSLLQSLEGYLRCQHCGTLLRNIRFTIMIRNSAVLFLIALILIVVYSDRIFRAFGIYALAVYWLILVFAASYFFVYFTWKYSVLVNAEKDSSRF